MSGQNDPVTSQRIIIALKLLFKDFTKVISSLLKYRQTYHECSTVKEMKTKTENEEKRSDNIKTYL